MGVGRLTNCLSALTKQCELTTCQLLPFQDNKLMLEHFHKPIVQKPVVAEGAVVWFILNEKLSNESDFNEMTEHCDNKD